jgi:uncharacterized membrane protein
MKFSFGKFIKIVLAVIGGNALYYSFEDRLPDIFHHKIFSWDWGLLLDFWLCVFLWVILDFLSRFRRRNKQ